MFIYRKGVDYLCSNIIEDLKKVYLKYFYHYNYNRFTVHVEMNSLALAIKLCGAYYVLARLYYIHVMDICLLGSFKSL